MSLRHLIFLFFIPLTIVFASSAVASHCGSDLQCQIDEIQKEIDTLKPAHERNEQELVDLRKQIASIKARINGINSELLQLEKSIAQREEDLGVQQELLEVRVRALYIRSRLYSPLMVFLASTSASQFTRELALRQQVTNEDRRIIDELSAELTKLNEDKKTLQTSRAGLARLQQQLDERAGFLAKEVEKVESYLSSLTAKQQELEALKAGGFQTSVGDTPPTLEPCSGPPGTSAFCDPGFKPAFGAFSFGAPHRTGMSQFGAYGRSKQGQSAEQILAAYYQGASLQKDYPSPDTIGVNGYGRIPFEENYLLGIYEVPEKWGDNGGFEALKAQAIAARSFALAVTSGGAGSICTTEACQVYKPQLKSGKWAEAVRATRGWVLIRDGAPAKAYYASTSGGYTISQWGWGGIKDTAGEWPDTAYEKSSGSPWFYKGWYRTRSGATCGRSNPWLTSEEMADILNAWHVLYKGGGDVSRISPVTTSCFSGNPYSVSELAGIGGYTSASSASVIYSNSGSTQSVSFSTNKGTLTLSGEEFKKAFNLRAPGYIGLKSSLFNIVKL
ncbi:hypothetical protein HYV21_01000 [Candidatus Microgenomates bacterium]|nr:hypothetical protein [Candidatus Microgenomates bacterium]